MTAKLLYLEKPDVKIPYYTWTLEQPRSILVLLHGLKSHSGWFLETGAVLAEKGIKMYVFDRRGSGKSESTRGHIENYHLWMEDIQAIIELARSENPYQTLHLLGHSFGAKLALAFALQHPTEVQSLVLAVPTQFSLKANITFLDKCKVVSSLLFRRKGRVKVPIRDEMFTRDPEKYRFIREDKLKLESMTSRFCFEMFKIDRRINRYLNTLSLPVLVLLASEDEVVDNLKIQTKFFTHFGSSRKALEMFHCAHDLFFEPENKKVIDCIAQWIYKQSQRE